MPEKHPEAEPVAARRDPTWVSPEGEAPPVPIGLPGWLMIAWRLPVVGGFVFGGLIVHLFLRLFERPVFGLRRPVTPWITQGVCTGALWLLGLRIVVRGEPMRKRGAVVANHVGWLDIFALNAPQRIYFVAKAEVATWAGIGWLARATGTVFIRRDAREARLQKEIFEARLRVGHHLCFFPEGTNSDGVRVLPFKPTLFAAFFAPELRDFLSIQPVSLAYVAPPGRDPRFYGWWGALPFGAHLLQVMAQTRQGRVEVIFHDPVAISDFVSRKDLARHCETEVRKGLSGALPPEVLRD